MLTDRWVKHGSSTSGTLSAVGSVPNVCHSLCLAIVTLLSTLGITLNILPLMFLMTYQRQFWWVAFILFLLAGYFYLVHGSRRVMNRRLLMFNAGLLLSGLPFAATADFMGSLRPLGIGAASVALLLLFLGQERSAAAPLVERKFSSKGAAWAAIILLVFFNQFMIKDLTSANPAVASEGSTTSRRMSLTLFDAALAKELMDENGDGLCDECGMDVQQCIDAGQLECGMTGDAKAIGILGSQHIHADWKIFINGQPFDWTSYGDQAMASSFLHIEPPLGKTAEVIGDVLHMHATNVPLRILFENLEGQLEDAALTMPDGQTYRSGGGQALAFYVNGLSVPSLKDYVFSDLDKIVISFGPADSSPASVFIDSVTDFAKDH